MRQHEYTYMTKLSIIMIFGNEVLEYYLKLIHHLRDILFIEKMTMMTGLCLLDEYLTATKLQVLKVVGTFWRDKLIFNCLVQDIEHSNFNTYPPILYEYHVVMAMKREIVIVNMFIFGSINIEATEFKHIFDNIRINRFLNVFSLFLFWNLFCRAISTSAKVLTKCLLLDISKSNLFHNMRWCFLKTYKR